jgi:hypothetical protein
VVVRGPEGSALGRVLGTAPVPAVDHQQQPLDGRARWPERGVDRARLAADEALGLRVHRGLDQRLCDDLGAVGVRRPSRALAGRAGRALEDRSVDRAGMNLRDLNAGALLELFDAQRVQEPAQRVLGGRVRGEGGQRHARVE